MTKRNVLQDGAGLLKDTAPELLTILSAASGTIPPPAGPIVKLLAESCLKVYNTAKKYKSSKKQIYRLSTRSVQVVTVIINKGHLRDGSGLDVDKKLKQVSEILDEICIWIQQQSAKGNWVDKLGKPLKAEDAIQEVNRLNKELDYALQLFELQSLIDSEKMLSEIRMMMTEYISDHKRTEMIQSTEQELGPMIKTLLSGDPRCYPETRQVLLDSIEQWLLNASPVSDAINSPSIYWLTGVAGCGKSTISRSVIEIAQKHRLLCSWFYFSRDYGNRGTSENLLTTTALDLLSSKDATLVKIIHDAVQYEKAHTSSYTKQFNEFLKRPLEAARFPVVLIWDGLDECNEKVPREELLHILKSLPKLPRSTRIFLTSRCENDLELTRKDLVAEHPGLIQHHDLTFNGDESDSTLDDIDISIRRRFEEMPGNKKGWPGNEALAKMRGIVDGLFIIADLACKIIREDYSELQSFLEAPTYEERETGRNPLYHWYRTGLDHALKRGPARSRPQVALVMSTILAVKCPLSPSALATLMVMDEQTMGKILDKLAPFLLQDTRRTEGARSYAPPVRYIHKSISNFLVSEVARDFQVDIGSASANLAVPCLKLLCETVSEGLRSCYSHSESASISGERQQDWVPPISEDLAYACRFWGCHLKDVSTLDENGKALLSDFFHLHLLDWLHIMGHLNELELAVTSLCFVQDWKLAVSISDIVELASDSIHFIQAFHDALRTCVDMECVSLHFTPMESRLYEVYSTTKAAKRSVIVRGIPSRWPRLLSALQGHMGAVTSVAFSPNGKHIASGSFDRTVHIWDVSTGLPAGPPLERHTTGVESVAFSPDGKHIVSGSSDKTLCIWEASTGKLVGTPLEGHADRVGSVAFSPDGKCIVSGSDDKTMCMWEAATGRLLGTPFQGHTSGVNSVAFSPDGEHIVSASSDKTVRVWDVSTGKLAGTPLVGHTDRVQSAVFSPDGKHIVSGSFDKTVRIWDVATGKLVGSPLEGHTAGVASVAFSPDGKSIISGSHDKRVHIWDGLTGMFLESLAGHTAGVVSLAFSPDGKQIASGSFDKTVCTWDASPGQLVGSPLKGHQKSIESIAISPDGRRIVSGSWDKTIRIWDVSTGQPLGTPLEHNDTVRSVAISPDGMHIVSGSGDGTVRIWDASTGNLVGTPLAGHDWTIYGSSVFSVAFSPDGTHIISGGDDEKVRIWETSSGNPVGTPLKGHRESIASVAISPDGKHIISGSWDDTVRMWDTVTGNLVRTLVEEDKTAITPRAVFSPDGKYIAVGSWDKNVRIMDASTGNLLGTTLKGHTNGVESVAFSPDGKRIASGSVDKTLRIWDASTGKLVGGPLQHETAVSSVAFSPNGKYVITGSDESVRIWHASPRQLVGTHFEGHTDSVQSVAFSPDGQRIISGSSDKTVCRWDVSTGQLVGTPLEGPTGRVCVSFSPDGNHIFARSWDHTFVWGESSGTLENVIENNDFTNPVHVDHTVSLQEDGWLKTVDGGRIAWLPVDRRGRAISWSERSRCFVVGAKTGVVTIIKLL